MSPLLSPTLGRAVLASLLIHALVLVGGGAPGASLRSPEAPLKAALGSGGTPATREWTARPSIAPPPELAPSKAPSRKEAPIRLPARQDPRPAASSEPGMAAAQTPPAEGVSADGVRQYRLALAREARLAMTSLGRAAGSEGRVEVVVTVGGAMPVPSVALETSSGVEPLDRQALELVARAARRASLPETLRGREFRLVLAVEFSPGD